MGAKLSEFYAKANAMGGLKAKMRLAVITNIPSANAEQADDSPENIKKFEAAFQEIKKEFS